MLAAAKDQQEADKKMAAAIAEQNSKQIEDANKDRSEKKGRMDADAKAIAGGGVTNGADLIFEEKCAGVISRVKAELEKFK